MEREEIAELVGCYFGLQQAGNMRLPIALGDEGSIVLNKLRSMIDDRMAEIEARLPPGTIDSWPNRS